MIFVLFLFEQKVHIHKGPRNLELGIKTTNRGSKYLYINSGVGFRTIGNIMTTNFFYAFMSALSELLNVFFSIYLSKTKPNVCISIPMDYRLYVKPKYINSYLN